ncbi:MAG: AraC family transcriptional regulator [Ignavibacteriae bacterium]|nr:AraC family transcriptional regulator [Ignavibacteriota bacterium]
MIFFIAAIHGIILGLLVANHKKYGKPSSNKLLGLAILFFSLCLVEYGLYTSGLFIKAPHIIASTNPFLFSVPPLMYFYVKSRLSLKINKIDFFCFVPVLIYLVLAVPFYVLTSEEKIGVVSKQENRYIIFHGFWAFYYLILWMFFGWLSLKFIKKREQLNNYSAQEKKELKWLRAIMSTFMIIALLDVGFYFLGNKMVELKTITAYITTTMHASIIYIMGYLAILNPKILFDQKPALYERSTLSNDKAKSILEEIIRYVENKKPFLDSSLRMSQLADELSISNNQLSQVLNQELDKNFNEFINSYRVKEVQERLKESKYQNLTMLAIAEDSGFNSKNAFNRAFKYHTGMTPSQYKKATESNTAID